MKVIALLSIIACVLLSGGCETTGSAQAGGNQEAKRRAALERQREQPPLDEAHANLWGAHQDILDRDSNPLRAY